MQILRDLLVFWCAIRKHWWPLMGSAAFTLLSLYVLIANKNANWAIYITLGLAVLFFMWSAFLGWRDEYYARIKAERAQREGYDGRPIFILKVYLTVDPGKPALRQWRLGLENCGTRVARFLLLQPKRSYTDKFMLWFGQIPVVKSGDEEHLGYWVTQGYNEKATLADFLGDHSADAALIWWDIKINFRDMDETAAEELVRLCYDVQTDVLYGTGVPYTEKALEKKMSANP